MESDPSTLDPALLAELPAAEAAAARLAGEWGLRLEGALAGATCSLLLRGVDAAGLPIALKVPLVEEERVAARGALPAFAGFGGVPVLRSDAASGATLMPLLSPGQTLADAHGLGDEATAIAAGLMRRMREAPLAATLRVADWMSELAAREPAGSPLDPLLPAAQEIAARLLEAPHPTVLLHGDLHHFNILRHGEEWLAIDPKGLLGDPAFEPAAFLRNPIGRLAGPDLVAVQRRRIAHFSRALGLPAWRIWGWGVALNALSVLGWSDAGAFRADVERAVLALWALRDEVG